MATIYYNSDKGSAGVADFAKIDATTEEDIARQIAEDDAAAAEDAALYAALHDEVAINLQNTDETSCDFPIDSPKPF